jgi:hypothetical protein
MNAIQRRVKVNQGHDSLLAALPQVLLIVVLAGLLVLLVATCIKFTNGSLSTSALKKHLLQLQSKFITSAVINPELERERMEQLQNRIKTSSDQATISADKELQQLFASNRNYIQGVMADMNLVHRSSWIKLKELMFSFDDFYFHA